MMISFTASLSTAFGSPIVNTSSNHFLTIDAFSSAGKHNPPHNSILFACNNYFDLYIKIPACQTTLPNHETNSKFKKKHILIIVVTWYYYIKELSINLLNLINIANLER